MKVSSTLAPGGIAVQPLQQQRHADAGQSRHAQVQKHRAHHHGAQREAVVSITAPTPMTPRHTTPLSSEIVSSFGPFLPVCE